MSGVSVLPVPAVVTSLNAGADFPVNSDPGVAIGATTASVTAGTLQTVLNLSSPGLLEGLYVYNGGGAASCEIKVTIDGTVAYSSTTLVPNGQARWLAGSAEHDLTNNVAFAALAALAFRKSLLVEVKSDGSNALTVGYRYQVTT